MGLCCKSALLGNNQHRYREATTILFSLDIAWHYLPVEGIAWRDESLGTCRAEMTKIGWDCEGGILIGILRDNALRERTFLKQPTQVLGSQDVWVSGSMKVNVNTTIRKDAMKGRETFSMWGWDDHGRLRLSDLSDRTVWHDYVTWLCVLRANFSAWPDIHHGSKPLTRSKISEISQWQKYFSELKISNPRISCKLNGVRRSSWKVVWVTKSSYASETSFRWQIFCSCSWRIIDMC